MFFVLVAFCHRQPLFGVPVQKTSRNLVFDWIEKDAHMTQLGDDHQPPPSVSKGAISRGRSLSQRCGRVPLAEVTVVRNRRAAAAAILPPSPPSAGCRSLSSTAVRRCPSWSSSFRVSFRRLSICVRVLFSSDILFDNIFVCLPVTGL